MTPRQFVDWLVDNVPPEARDHLEDLLNFGWHCLKDASSKKDQAMLHALIHGCRRLKT